MVTVRVYFRIMSILSVRQVRQRSRGLTQVCSVNHSLGISPHRTTPTHKRHWSINHCINTWARLTIVCNASVFAQKAEVQLLLVDDALVLRPQTGRVTGEYEGVAVQAGAVLVYQSAGVVDGVVIVVGVDDPVLIIWERGGCEGSDNALLLWCFVLFTR